MQYVFVVAGVADNARLDLANIDDGTMINLFQTNAMGPLFVAKHLVNGNLVRAGSVIVNITSKVEDLNTKLSMVSSLPQESSLFALSNMITMSWVPSPGSSLS